MSTTFRGPSGSFGDDAGIRRTAGYPSPTDWRDEVLYLLLPDRFSDGREDSRSLLDRSQVTGWTDLAGWADSGYQRFQGGTLRGVISKLDYLADLGVTAIWLGPPWKGRAERDEYHGYAIQHFQQVDPRLGTNDDLVELVYEAHRRDMRVIFDVIVNHTAPNWLYETQLDGSDSAPPPFQSGPPDQPPGRYPFGAWLAGDGTPLLPANSEPRDPDDGVWPAGALQSPDAYHRAGQGSYSDSDPARHDSAWAEFRWADSYNRDLALTDGPLRDAVLEAIIDCWTFWIKLTDCDGFRIDTFKHFRVEEARRFCGAIREQAEAMGKDNFLLLAEVGGGDTFENEYLSMLGANLTAVLEIGDVRVQLRKVAGGEESPGAFFDAWRVPDAPNPGPNSEGPTANPVGSHRSLGGAFVYSLDDHDNLSLNQLRFATEFPGRTVPAVALLTLTLGIPCLYYGTEQALAIPPSLLAQLPNVNDRANGGDRYIREAMFGPEHPRRSGRAGRPQSGDPFDPTMPGFGPYGTSGQHVFSNAAPTFLQIAAILATRREYEALRRGRQYLREVRVHAPRFEFPAAGQLAAWSRILADAEVLCIVNLDQSQAQSGDITVDATLNPEGSLLKAVLDTSAQPARPATGAGPTFKVAVTPEGRHYVNIPQVQPGAVVVLAQSTSQA